MEDRIVKIVEKQLSDLRPKQIHAVLDLLGEGDTVPFIARYRKERTGSLDEVQIRDIQSSYNKAESLEKRRDEVLKLISEQDKLTPALEKQLKAADKLQTIEDLYLPYKQKRRTKATIAKEKGLEPFAYWLLTFPQDGLKEKAAAFLNPEKEVASIEEVFSGAHEILAEAFGDSAGFRDWIRNHTRKNGRFESKVKAKGEQKDEQGVYQLYYDFDESLANMVSHRVLAINRGEKEGVLKAQIKVDDAAIMRYLHFRIIGSHNGPAVSYLEAAYEDAYKRFIGPAIERELRNELSDEANTQAIHVFGENLYHLLMQAPIKGKVVLGFDPAYRTGCKLAIMDPNGKFLAKKVIYPHKPASDAKRKAAAGEFKRFLEDYHVEMIAIGNGTASRESEEFVSSVLKTIDRKIYYVIVNEAGASVYSASKAARDAFPELHVEERSAISIGRRLQDPLAELIKIDPKAVGVGQYQHDVPQKELTSQLDTVIETAVNQVGVNLNTASPQLLAHISGLTKTTAQNIVTWRDENGSYEARNQLKKVPRLGPKAYEQSVGFLRIVQGKNALDNTDIHPESYKAAKKLLKKVGLSIDQIGTQKAVETFKSIDLTKTATELEVGSETLKDIIAGLEKPGRDLRDEMPAPLLRSDVLTLKDLKPGMKLQGTVRNVVDFGAFVDIGVKQDGLVHISKLTKKYIKNPGDVVSVGDVVTVWVESIDLDRQRIQLTMLDPEEK
ncbi:Tex family protein [Pediococcus cellicola]|uniref:Tex family protein n=1 Tax=Pediococcus cellicola TaxID=319652 RepID=UPI00070FA0B1|nr:Tex family protein [Pediococcus cellicola]GEL14572.1 S1 RNA-binding protein [Pediococcus cellicola]